VQAVGKNRSSKIFWEDGNRIKFFLRVKKILCLYRVGGYRGPRFIVKGVLNP